MTNLERYPNTKDALDAWSKYGPTACAGSSFTDWLLQEYGMSMRNCDKYATAKEACAAFNSLCDARSNCSGCPVRKLKNRTGHCEIDWLYSKFDAGEEAEKGETK